MYCVKDFIWDAGYISTVQNSTKVNQVAVINSLCIQGKGDESLLNLGFQTEKNKDLKHPCQ